VVFDFFDGWCGVDDFVGVDVGDWVF